MNTIRFRRAVSAVVSVALMAARAACSDDDASDSSSSEASTTTTVDDSWKEEAGAVCAAYEEAMRAWAPEGFPGTAENVTKRRELRDTAPSVESIDLPESLRTAPNDVLDRWHEADESLALAEQKILDGDSLAASDAVMGFEIMSEHIIALLTLGGAPCGDPTRVANADLNIPIPTVHRVENGFGSVWATSIPSELPASAIPGVYRVDPDSGEVLATIDVGSDPQRLQPADDRMIVRTTDAIVAIDPSTNTVVQTLPNADIGPAITSAYSVDAVWICDGTRLHRYDPSTLAPLAGIDLAHDCGRVFATEDLVVASTYNDDPGESGTAEATFLDPSTNTALATIDLPADPGGPVALDDVVFLPGVNGPLAMVVDRATWTIRETHDFERDLGGAQPAFDGTSIFVIADNTDVLVIDPETYEVTDVLEPIRVLDKVNSLATSPGALWVATGDAGILHRYDLPS